MSPIRNNTNKTNPVFLKRKIHPDNDPSRKVYLQLKKGYVITYIKIVKRRPKWRLFRFIRFAVAMQCLQGLEKWKG